jgi:hypothetical protein
MKSLLSFFKFLIVGIIIAQVPPSRYEIDTGVSEKPRIEDSDVASTYSTKGKYGFIYPKNNKQEAQFEKINSIGGGFIIQKNGNFGLADEKGNIILKAENDSIFQINHKYGNGIILKSKNKYGTIDLSGKTVLPPKYEKILFSHQNLPYSLVREKDKVKLIFHHQEKEFPKPIEYAEIYNNLMILKVEGKYGAIKQEETIVPFEYDAIFHSISYLSEKEKLANVQKPKTEIKYINSVKPFNLIVKKGEKFGLVDLEGKEVFKPIFDKIYFDGGSYSHNYYTLKKDDLIGAYFSSSQKLIPVEFQSIHPDGYSIFKVIKNGKMGIYNREATLIVPPEYESVHNLNSSSYIVTKDRKKGLLDKDGKTLIPPMYDNLDNFYELPQFYQVKQKEKMGIVNEKNEIIIPIEYEYVGQLDNYFRVITPEPDRKSGLYSMEGEIVIPVSYKWIKKSSTENSQILILEHENGSYNFLSKNGKLIFSESFASYGYLMNEVQLLNPYRDNGNSYLYFKDKKGKFGIFNETTAKISTPATYDSIYQKFSDDKFTYFKLKKGNKFGIINNENQIIIPFKYDDLDINYVHINQEKSYTIIASNGKKYGTINLQNKTIIPFQYSDLKRLNYLEIFKAKKGNHYILIDGKNNVLNEGPFDDIANFENINTYFHGESEFQALTFLNGKMKLINLEGNFISSEIPMKPHKGFSNFEELKKEFVKIMNSEDDELLRDFASKIAPSEHILFYLKKNVFSHEPLYYINVDHVIETYYQELRKFKYQEWNSSYGLNYRKDSWIKVNDFTGYEDGYITNRRIEDWAYGSRILEKLFRNSYKINGFWISSYFMSRHYSY